MSPISVNLSRKIPTGLEINGPILSYTTQPQSTSVCNGELSVEFIGISTATFPEQIPQNIVQNSGTLNYQWYEVGVGPLSDSDKIIGSATTTLNLLNLSSPSDSDKKFFLRTTHNVSIGSSTPFAQNNPLDSNIITLTIFPEISIVNQPIDVTVGIDRFAEYTVDVNLSDTRQGNISYQWSLNGNSLTNSTNVTGANTDTLRIKSQAVGINTVQAIITHPTSCTSPLYSNVVSFNVVEPREIIRFEGITNSTTAVIQDYDLSNGQLQFDFTTFAENLAHLSFYSLEKPIELELDLYGAKGSNNGSFSGGNGGYSRIRINMNRDEEHVLSGLRGSGLFLYRKSRLIAVVGGGGNAGTSGNGGAGGGVNLGGLNGSGRGGGLGGALIQAGQLTTTGIFGSSYTSTFSFPDTKAQAPNGGRSISCSKGFYWINQGFSACQDVGTQKFRLSNGNEVTNTSLITRGFKVGTTVTTTAGLGLNNGGNGSNGATGGNGGTDGAGGGGGSGYTDGSIEIVRTLSGENTTTFPLIIIRSRTFIFDVEFEVELWGGKGANWTIGGLYSGGLGGYTKLKMIIPSNYTLQVRPSFQGSNPGGTPGGSSSAILFENNWLAVVGGGGGAGGSYAYDATNQQFSLTGGNPGGSGSGGFSTSGDPSLGQGGLSCSSSNGSNIPGTLFIFGSASGAGGGGAPGGSSGGTCCCPPPISSGGGPSAGGQGGSGNIRIYRDQQILNGFLNLDNQIFMEYLTHSNGISSGNKIRIKNLNSNGFIDYTTNADVPLIDISNI